MRNWLLIIILGWINLAVAEIQELDVGLMQVFNTLQAQNDHIKHFSVEKLEAMNAFLAQLETKYRVEEVSEYQDGPIQGTRYIIKNITLEPMVVAKKFAMDDNLLALMVSNNILAADAQAIVYVLKAIK